MFYLILRKCAKMYFERKKNRGVIDSQSSRIIDNALLLIKIDEAWEVYQREIKKVKP